MPTTTPRRARTALVCLLLAATSACGGSEEPVPTATGGGGVVAPTETETPSPTPSRSLTPSPSESPDDADESGFDEDADSNSSDSSARGGSSTENDGSTVGGSPSPGVLTPESLGSTVRLNDVFRSAGTWDEARYDIADRSDVQGLGTSITSCGENYAAELELRLARNFDSLTMDVGQANDSPSSDEQLVVAIVSNGEQVDTRTVPFDAIQPFALDVRDVNALKLRFWIDPEACKGSNNGVIAVVQNMTLT